MCTVSFLPNRHGFYLAMNRDEKRERFAALAPAIVDLEGHRAVFPTEPNGGTWISANDAGVCLALINWHRIERRPKNDTISRGLVVRELAEKASADKIAAALSYTEVAVSERRATMRYKSGPCCSNGALVSKTISLAH